MQPKPPFAFRALIRMASWLAPGRARRAWHDRWQSGLGDWWILVERGELIGGASAQMALSIRTAFVDAFWLRCNKAYFEYWVRGPGFVMTAAILVLLSVAALTHGFTVTRTLIDIALGRPAPPILGKEGPAGTLIAYAAPIVLALAAGVVLVVIGRLSLHRYGWRYWSFLAMKTLFVMTFVPTMWIEGGTLARVHSANSVLRVYGAGVGLTAVFIFAFGWALVRDFDDQRRRCPVCLRLLSMPIVIGSWASVFEPAVTELLCDAGHGALWISESASGQPDRWTALDASWHDLFAARH